MLCQNPHSILKQIRHYYTHYYYFDYNYYYYSFNSLSNSTKLKYDFRFCRVKSPLILSLNSTNFKCDFQRRANKDGKIFTLKYCLKPGDQISKSIRLDSTGSRSLARTRTNLRQKFKFKINLKLTLQKIYILAEYSANATIDFCNADQYYQINKNTTVNTSCPIWTHQVLNQK